MKYKYEHVQAWYPVVAADEVFFLLKTNLPVTNQLHSVEFTHIYNLYYQTASHTSYL